MALLDSILSVIAPDLAPALARRDQACALTTTTFDVSQASTEAFDLQTRQSLCANRNIEYDQVKSAAMKRMAIVGVAAVGIGYLILRKRG